MLYRTSPLLLLCFAIFGCDATGNEAEAPLRFDPESCDDQVSASILTISGLDDELAIDGVRVVTDSGRFASVNEALDMLTFPGPHVTLSKTTSVAPLELWERPPGDFGAVAWVDTSTNEVVFAGSVIWMGTGNAVFPPGDPSVLVGDAPVEDVPTTSVPNQFWTAPAVVDSALKLGLRSEVVARYAACGDPVIAVYVYTPRVGATDPKVARALVMVAGRRAETSIP